MALYKIRVYIIHRPYSYHAVMRLILSNKQTLKHTAIKILMFTINKSSEIVIKYLTSLNFADLLLLPCFYLIYH